jgi:hypothetical protein
MPGGLVKLVLVLVLVLAAAACRPPLGPILEVTAERAVQLPRALEHDPRVRVKEPSSVYVIQDSRVRAVVEWPGTGEGLVTVPVKTIDDGSGPIFIGVRRGEVAPIDDPWTHAYCIVCEPDGGVRCCPKGTPGPKPDPSPSPGPTPTPTPGPDPQPDPPTPTDGAPTGVTPTGG